MNRSFLFSLFTAVVLFLSVASHHALAGSTRNPSSLLIFPYYNTNYNENRTIATVTNICSHPVYINMVNVEAEYFNGDEWLKGNCVTSSSWLQLSGKDHFTYLVDAVIPYNQRGYMYFYTVEFPGTNIESKDNCLIGQELIHECGPQGGGLRYTINAAGFLADPGETNEWPNGDGTLKLDETEYSLAPAAVKIPNFFGQDPKEDPNPNFRSYFTLIDLTGGAGYQVNTKVDVFNDKGKQKGHTHLFQCWEHKSLQEISEDFNQSELLKTNHDPNESFEGQEYGWFQMTGLQAFTPVHKIDYPSLFGFLIKGINGGEASDLSWEGDDPELYVNGRLGHTPWPRMEIHRTASWLKHTRKQAGIPKAPPLFSDDPRSIQMDVK